MSSILDISHVTTPPAGLRSPQTRPAPHGDASHRSAETGDTLELSPIGRMISGAAAESSMRLARIRAIRAEILTGSYETNERIDGTVRRLLDILA